MSEEKKKDLLKAIEEMKKQIWNLKVEVKVLQKALEAREADLAKKTKDASWNELTKTVY
jgi:hypothetical protein